MDTPTDFDRRSGLRADTDALEAMLDDPSSVLVPVHRGRLPVRCGVATALESPPAAATLALPAIGPARRLLDGGGELVFLGVYQERAHFAIDISAEADPLALPGLTPDCALWDLLAVVPALPAVHAHLAAYAREMLHFHEHQRFCGRCGARTRPRQGGHARACGACDRELFPQLSPVVVVLVQHRDRVLLGRQPGWPRGMYSLLAGFVESGESLESAAAREVREETGVVVRELSYLGSQPWPFPASLVVAMQGTATDGRIQLDDEELEDARFFSRSELTSPEIPGFFVPNAHSLSGAVIARFVAQGSERDTSGTGA